MNLFIFPQKIDIEITVFAFCSGYAMIKQRPFFDFERLEEAIPVGN